MSFDISLDVAESIRAKSDESIQLPNVRAATTTTTTVANPNSATVRGRWGRETTTEFYEHTKEQQGFNSPRPTQHHWANAERQVLG